ncbi:erythromycin esterase family protein [Streptomyces sp. FZ201]|uniref:erythromycin esterase family protein n=1 Tax=Streptomyces sp. FZ201 TaxID=3057122 RepID=UPI0021C01C57|nr:erythromycin esterase family protein [Streptomyces sp. FZ201]
MKRHRTATALTLFIILGTTASVLPAAAAAPPVRATAASDHDGAVVDALARAAHPLRTVEPGGDTRDLRALDRMIGDARVVGLGEATHGSHDFFALKGRVLRHLVEERGFRAFALEAPWSTVARLDAYVVRGEGDPRRIMRDEFQRDYRWWNNTDYLRLIEWARAYNLRHPADPVRLVGDDIAWSGPELYDAVTGYAAGRDPKTAARLEELYRGLRPTEATGAYIDRYLGEPYAVREERAQRTGQALRLLRGMAPGKDRAAYERAVQDARVIDQTARQYAFDFTDPAQVSEAMRYRGEQMAANVLWWQRHTGARMLLSAHNNHVGYVPDRPAQYLKAQGAVLRDALGAGYVSVGLTFDHGSFRATGTDDETVVRRWAVGPAGPGTNEVVLDRVPHRNYVLDLRTVGSPAREWLRRARPTRSVGTAYPDGPHDIALARSYDVLIHLHRVSAARLLER